jgi:hypothetical protein
MADVLVWQQVALGYALIATTIPTLKNFIRGYNHALGGGSSTGKRGLGGGYNLGSHVRSGNQTNNSNNNNSRLASKLISKPHSKQNSMLGTGSKVRQEQEEGFQMGPVSGDYRVGAFHDSGPPRDRPSDAGSDDPIIIRRDMSVTVETERASWTPNSTRDGM